MAIQLNHTILAAKDPRETADFFTRVFGLAEPENYGPFLVLQLSNAVSLDVLREDGPITPQHYAFLVGESEFDEIFGRLTERGEQYWADPFHREPGRINHWYGGRGVYFLDPSGHKLEIMTKPYEIG
ncbi:VOC family protein [Kitasatospora sp. LaBMicrA B282]|uniref:VOC family protein n=1 Tax=Kitasatospora sp. LaBMicrA B282 TaxID=3420949 RepID=UPI003D10315C